MSLSQLVQRIRGKGGSDNQFPRATRPEEEEYGLFTLQERPPRQNGVVDIVAIHGLGGHAYNTWTDREKLWLRDFLPSQIPNARIMSYGYNSAVAFSKSVAGIEEFAEDLLNRLDNERATAEERARPIIFICHSLGGILVKKALILAHERSSFYSALLQRIWGLVFMGTPHRGSDVAFWTDFLARALHVAQFGAGTNKNLVSSLKKDSRLLSDISDQFVERSANLQIRTFYEMEKLDYMNILIVDKTSASLNLSNEKRIPIQANHRTMCRFSSADSQKYRPVWKAIEELAESARSGVTTNSAFALSELQIEALQCLRKSDYEDYKESIASRAEGTCTWFLQHEKYLSWLKEENSAFLWLSADPGCGKTVLSSFLVDELKSDRSQATFPATICYFFCDDKIESQKDGAAVLCGLTHQLLCANPSLIHHATQHFKIKGSRFANEIRTLWDILDAASADSEAGNIVCIIDAIDECEEFSRSLLIKWFMEYFTKSPGQRRNFMKAIMTSRGYQSIEIAFLKGIMVGERHQSIESASHFASQVRLMAEDLTESINSDVGLVVKKRLRDVQAITSCSEETRLKIEGRLTENADRTFLWVSLVLDLLENSTEASADAFDRITTSLPRKLDEIYEKILQDMPEQEQAKKALTLLVTALRPLTLEELNIALHLRETDRSIEDLKSRLEPAMGRKIKGLCGPFIRVIDSRVHLVHQTAKEFLVKPYNNATPLKNSWKHCLEPAKSNFVLARICIWYLSFDIFEQQPLAFDAQTQAERDHQVENYVKNHDFLDYAVKYWGNHFRRSESYGEQGLLKPVLELCDSRSGRFTTWFQVFWTTISQLPSFPQNLTTLMLASYFGHKSIVQLLLKEGVDINAMDSMRWTALHWAVWEGNGIIWEGHEAVQALLEAGAEVEIQDTDGMTALHWAAYDGQEAIVRLLLEAGARIKTKSSSGLIASGFARIYGYEDVVRLLEEKEDDTDAKENSHDVSKEGLMDFKHGSD